MCPLFWRFDAENEKKMVCLPHIKIKKIRWPYNWPPFLINSKSLSLESRNGCCPTHRTRGSSAKREIMARYWLTALKSVMMFPRMGKPIIHIEMLGGRPRQCLHVIRKFGQTTHGEFAQRHMASVELVAIVALSLFLVNSFFRLTIQGSVECAGVDAAHFGGLIDGFPPL